MAGVNWVRGELSYNLKQYALIFDCLEGDNAIKGRHRNQYYTVGFQFPMFVNRREDYLPMPNGLDRSEENYYRYEQYSKRAIFYNFTARTLEGMQGQIFLRPPAVNNVPDALDVILDDADGNGISLQQLAQNMTADVIPYGRCGLLVDYPAVIQAEDEAQTAATSIQQLADGTIRPTITMYHPWDIINWRTERQGANTVLSMVVLRESIIAPQFNEGEEDHVFELAERFQYRVCYLDRNGEYHVDIYDDLSAKGKYEVTKSFHPKDGKGRPFVGMPFTFIGAQSNNWEIDKPPMYDLAVLNVGHFRNSADYEEACFMRGQPTLIVTGIDKQWIKDELDGVFTFGARNAIPLPAKAKAELLTMDAGNVAFESMKHKEEQAVALGAKLVQSQRTVRTATETTINTISENSVLTKISNNVSRAIEWALNWCGTFMDLPTVDATYQLNTDYEFNSLSANDLANVVKTWQGEAISFSEMREQLRRAGLATQDDKDAEEEIQAQIKRDQAQALQQMQAETAVQTPPTLPGTDPNLFGGK